jgi:hypothetical protein
MQIVTWMGGSRPHKLDAIGSVERAIVRKLLSEQIATHAQFWGDCPLDVCRTFWKRARYDAHATIREAIRTGAERIYG